MKMLTKETLNKLSEQGKSGVYSVVDVKTRPITEYVNVMVVQDETTGKFYRGEFMTSSDYAVFVEVAVKPSVEYVPLDN